MQIVLLILLVGVELLTTSSFIEHNTLPYLVVATCTVIFIVVPKGEKVCCTNIKSKVKSKMLVISC